jgi:hypothetical protein
VSAVNTSYNELNAKYEELKITSQAKLRAQSEINEKRMKELENTLTNAYHNLRSLDNQVKDLQ